MTDIKVEINEDGTFKPSGDPDLDSALEELDQYVSDFKTLERKLDQIPWIYRTILYIPIGVAIEWYWIRQMGKLNEEFSKKHNLEDA